MPEFSRLFKPRIPLPPSGWLLAGMLAFYVLAGLFKDPWAGQDATHINIAWQILQSGDFFHLNLAGREVFYAPLYYWSAAITGFAFSPFLETHDAIRLASGFWVAAALAALYYASRELYGKESAAAAPMLLAGSLGLILHAHDAQPVLIALTAHTAALGGIAAFVRKPKLGGIFYGLALAACVLGTGFLTTLPLLFLAFFAWFCPNKKNAAFGLVLGFAIAIFLIACAALLFYFNNPLFLKAFLKTLRFENLPFSFDYFSNTLKFLALLPWFAFPTLPLALYSLWVYRKKLFSFFGALPLVLWLFNSLLLALVFQANELPALLLLPPLALLATPAVLALKRGAAALFDWFSICVFSLFCALAWICWSAMHFGFPAKLSERIFVLRPGFAPSLEWLPLMLALLTTIFWGWLILKLPRHAYRALMHWTLGVIAFWFISACLIIDWFDYGKSYRPMSEKIAPLLVTRNRPSRCLAEYGLGEAQRAAFSYFLNLNLQAWNNQNQCDFVLTTRILNLPILWEGSRAGRARREWFRLYRR